MLKDITNYFPELEFINTPESDDDLFDDETSLDEIPEPSETELKKLEEPKDEEDKFLPIEKFSVYKCNRCNGYHDLLEAKWDDGNPVCPVTHRSV